MIINEQKSNIQVVGDITEFKSSIDPKNLEFITTLLSSNLYSAPERSFIREIVSNAWDAQVEAGTTDIPIIIKITETKYNTLYSGIGDITIRDFGTGLSPERFNEIYRNIGSSTKRESNDYHGAFGIGHLSGFSCSNTMYITSYYNDTCYEYIGIKDANNIVYTLVSTTPTTEKNGLEVTIKNVALDKYRKALKYISFFPNVFVEDDRNRYITDDTAINNIKIKKYNNFWVSSYITKDKLLLGNVLYPLNEVELNLRHDNPLLDFLERIETSGIVLKFDIGELSVTPNRENIIYTKDCIDKIINKLNLAINEINDIIINKSSNFTNITAYTNVITSSPCFDFFEEQPIKYTYGFYRLPKDGNTIFTYKHNNLFEYKNILWYLVSCINYCTKYFICDSRIYNGDSLPYRRKIDLNLNTLDGKNLNLLILEKDIKKLSRYLREYLLLNYNNNYAIIEPLNLNKIKDKVINNLKIDIKEYPDIDSVIQEVIDYIYSKGTVVDFDNDSNFLEYRENRKKEVKLQREDNYFEKIIIYVYKNYYYRADKHVFTTLKDCVNCLKKLHRGIVIVDRTTADKIINAILARGFTPVFANQKLREVLKNYSFNIPIEWVLHEDPYLTHYKTIMALVGDEANLTGRLTSLMEIISPKYICDIKDIMKVYSINRNYYTIATDFGKIDESLKKKVLKIKEFLRKYDEAIEILDDSGVNINSYYPVRDNNYISLITKILIKNKSFLVNSSAYRKMKRNKLINVLCKK